MVKLPTNYNNLDSKHKKNSIPRGLIILILIIAVADFVMIAEIPYFVTKLQIGGKNHGPDHPLSHDQKELDNFDSLFDYEPVRKIPFEAFYADQLFLRLDWPLYK